MNNDSFSENDKEQLEKLWFIMDKFSIMNEVMSSMETRIKLMNIPINEEVYNQVAMAATQILDTKIMSYVFQTITQIQEKLGLPTDLKTPEGTLTIKNIITTDEILEEIKLKQPIVQ